LGFLPLLAGLALGPFRTKVKVCSPSSTFFFFFFFFLGGKLAFPDGVSFGGEGLVFGGDDVFFGDVFPLFLTKLN